jgi:CsoR family transcriptional regulator, copper-sensing transcriptional repressor
MQTTPQPHARTSHIDEALTTDTLARLRRIEGQVRGLQAMVADHRWCPDILTQIASVHEALRAVGKGLVTHHLQHCVTHAARSDDPAERDAVYEELVQLLYKQAR